MFFKANIPERPGIDKIAGGLSQGDSIWNIGAISRTLRRHSREGGNPFPENNVYRIPRALAMDSRFLGNDGLAGVSLYQKFQMGSPCQIIHGDPILKDLSFGVLVQFTQSTPSFPRRRE